MTLELPTLSANDIVPGMNIARVKIDPEGHYGPPRMGVTLTECYVRPDGWRVVDVQWAGSANSTERTGDDMGITPCRYGGASQYRTARQRDYSKFLDELIERECCT